MKNPTMRPAIFLLMTLALSAPTLMNIVSGADSATSAGAHLAAAILVAWAAVSVVGHLVDSYRASVARRSLPHAAPHGAPHTQQSQTANH